MRILLVEDEKDLNKIITKTLQENEFAVDSCHDGEEALDFVDMTDYDGAILDIMLPGASGYEILEAIKRKNNETPVMFLTALDSINDRVKGLEYGADDYLVKPFALDEMLARLRALTRRSFGKSSNMLTIADLSLNMSTHEVTRKGKIINLSSKEFQLLQYMMQNEGTVLSKDTIENHIWNADYEGGTNVVAVYVSYLREKIDKGFDLRLIHTIRGRGYVIKKG